MTYQSLDDEFEQERHRRFTDRQTEMDLFEQLIRTSHSRWKILEIHGDGGVGKSELLLEFKILCREWSIPYLSVDAYALKTPVKMLSRLRGQAGSHSPASHFVDFDRYLALYKRIQKRIHKDEELIVEFLSALEQGASERWAAVESSQVESVASTFLESFDPEDIEFLFKAHSFLTSELMKSLAKSNASRWVLMLDAYESVEPLSELDHWVRDHLIRQLPAIFRVVLVGRRSPVERWSKSWPQFGEHCLSIHLMNFDESDTKDYFANHGIVEADLVREIFELTEGCPLYLALAARAKRDNDALSAGDFSPDKHYLVTESLVKYIVDSVKDPVILQALKVCAIVRFFQETTLDYFLPGEAPGKLLDELRRYPFVKKRSYGFALHDSVWEFLNQKLREDEDTLFTTLNEMALSFYRDRIQHAREDEWQPFAIEILYHKIALSAEDALPFLVDAFIASEARYRLDLCEALIAEAMTHKYKSDVLEDWLMFLEARLAHRRDDWGEARSRYEKLRNKPLPTELRGHVLDGLGKVYYRFGYISQAEGVYAEAFEAYTEVGRERDAVGVIYQMAKIKVAQRQWQAAKKSLVDSLRGFDDLLDRLSKESWPDPLRDPRLLIDRDRAQILGTLGTVYFSQGFWDEALEQYTKALEVFQRLRDDYDAGCSLYRVGWALQQKGNWDQAVSHYKQSRGILIKLKADYRVARTIVKLADVYRMQGRLEESEDVYLECMRICVKLKAELGIAVVLDSLGVLYQARGLLQKAETMHRKSLERKHKIDFPFEIELTWMNIGDLRAKQGDVQQALQCYSESLRLMQNMKNRHGEALLLVKMSEVISRSPLLSSDAFVWAKKAESIAKKHDYHDVQCRIHRLRGDWFVSAESYEHAWSEYLEALREARCFNEYVYEEMRQSLLLGSIEWRDAFEAKRLQNWLSQRETSQLPDTPYVSDIAGPTEKLGPLTHDHARPQSDRQGCPLHILHLSDIHLGTTREARIYCTQLETDLKRELKVEKLEYMVVSGDVAHKSSTDEYGAALLLIEQLGQRFGLNSSHIIIVPGNHDLNWQLSKEAYSAPVFKDELPDSVSQESCISVDRKRNRERVVVRDEPLYRLRFAHFSEHLYCKLQDGKTYPSDYHQQGILYFYPEDRILFLGLNSSWEIDHHYTDRASICMDALCNALDQLQNSRYDNWLKIAVWHHPVSGRETMDDQFLQLLAVNDFQVCMHGHIHEAIEGFHRYDPKRQLRIVGAGTFGAPLSKQAGIPLQYNLMRLDLEKRTITVETRKREKPNGTWMADARWGDKNQPVPYYKIELR